MATAPVKKTAKQLQAEIDAANAIAEKAKAELAKLDVLTKLCEQFKKDVAAASFTVQDAIAELDQNYNPASSPAKKRAAKKTVANKPRNKTDGSEIDVKNYPHLGSIEPNSVYKHDGKTYKTTNEPFRIRGWLKLIAVTENKPFSHYKVK